MERQKLGIICGVKGLFRGPRSRFAICFFLFAISLPLYSQTQTELGSEGDLTVLGTGGTALDPNTEIKGFTVFGSTQAAYTGAVIGNGNVVVNGVLAVSSGAYFVGNSTFPAAAKIFINDGSPGQILSKNSGGWLEWFNAGAIGDNLGTHIATQTLNLAGWNMVNVSSVNFRPNVFISSASAAQHGGIYVSSNIYIVGFSSAAKYYGDGSSLTGVASAEALGSKIGGSGTPDWVAKFQGSGNAITDSSIYDNGTVVVFTNAASSVTIYGKDAASGYSLLLSSGLNMPDGTVNAGLLRLSAANNITISSETSSALGAGLRISTNIYIVGFSSAAKYYGDGSSLTGIAGDNLGNHTATQDLLLGGNDIYNASTITATGNISAARYQINGSTMVAILPGTGSIAYGVNAGTSNITGGDYNVFIGNSAGASNTTGANNTAIGAYALYSNMTGVNNTVNGYAALYNSQTGSGNSIFGHKAGLGVSGNSFSDSTIMGYEAGYSLTTGSNNVFLGLHAGFNVAAGAGNIVIGYEKDTSAPGASNELNIGGLLYGDLSGKTVGISTRAPQAALDIVSTGTLINQYAQIWRASDGTIVSSMTATGVLYPAVSGSDNTKVAKTGDTMTGQLTISGSSLTVIAPDTIASSLWVSTSATTPHLYVSTNGKVGIGTTSPGSPLDVAGNINSSTAYRIGTNNLGQYLSQLTVFESQTYLDYNGPMHIRYIPSLGGAVSEKVTIDANGNVGVGTTAPSYRLHVSSGAGEAGTIMAVSTGATNIFWVDGDAAHAIKFVGDGSQLTNLTGAADNLGNHIATATLDMAGFDLVNVSSVNYLPNVFMSSATAAQGGGVYISSNVYIVGFSSAAKYYGDGSALTGIAGGLSGPSIDISTINATATTPYGGVNITTNTFVMGNVGIGLNNPSAALQVQAYAAGSYSMYISTSSTAGQYSIAVASTGVTNINSLVIENRTSAPASPVTGQIWLRVD